jgi:general secretion pathway protein L
MPEPIVVMAQGDGRWAWATGPTATDVVTSGGLKDLCRGRRVILLLPGTEVATYAVRVPARTVADQRKAARYALEDQLAQRIEDLHFAVGTRTAAGELPVAIISRERLHQHLDALRSTGVEPATAVPDFLALPWRGDAVSLCLDGGLYRVRAERDRGFAVESRLLPATFGPATRLRQWTLAAADNDAAVDARLRAAGAEIAQENAPATLAALCAAGLRDAPPSIDLLQGDLHPSAARLAWGPAAALLALAVAAHLGFNWLEYQRLRTENANLAQRVEKAFHVAFPEIRRIVDPRAQTEQRLAELRAGAGRRQDFVELMERAAGLIGSVAGVEIDGLNYRDGALELRCRAPAIGTLEELRQQLQALRLRAEIATAESGANGVTGRILIREASS